jgi:hypothetical protein
VGDPTMNLQNPTKWETVQSSTVSRKTSLNGNWMPDQFRTFCGAVMKVLGSYDFTIDIWHERNQI